MKKLILLTFILISAPAYAIPVANVVNPIVAHGAFVEDQAQVLGPEYSALINAISHQLKDKTGDELAVVTVDTLDGITVDDYGEQLFKRFGIGQKGKDNGVLILLSRDDRRIRIEVGYGLESILNDAKVGRLLDDHGVPYLKENQFGLGLYETAKAVALTVADAAHVDLQVTDPVLWPAQPSVALGALSDNEAPIVKEKLPFFLVFFAMLVLIPLALLGKMISYSRRQTLKGRKAAITQFGGLTVAAFVLPPLGAVMFGYSEHVLTLGLLAALIPITVDAGLWFGLKWMAHRVDLWHPQCATCHQAMAFVRTETTSPGRAERDHVSTGTATDLWRCITCDTAQQFSDTIYYSGGDSSGSSGSYSRPSSSGGSSGGGSSGGGGASRGF